MKGCTVFIVSALVFFINLKFSCCLDMSASPCSRTVERIFGTKNVNCSEATVMCNGIAESAHPDPDVEAVCTILFPTPPPSETDMAVDPGGPSSAAIWGYGVLCVTIISLMSLMGVSFLPLMSKGFYDHLLTSLIGLAVGSLTGSALFHLIPSAFSLSRVSFFSHHSYLDISLVIWAGIYLFFLIERFLKIFMEYKSRANGVAIPSHSHNHNNHKNNQNMKTGTPAATVDSMFAIVSENNEEEDEEAAEKSSDKAIEGCATVIPKSEVDL